MKNKCTFKPKTSLIRIVCLSKGFFKGGIHTLWELIHQMSLGLLSLILTAANLLFKIIHGKQWNNMMKDQTNI